MSNEVRTIKLFPQQREFLIKFLEEVTAQARLGKRDRIDNVMACMLIDKINGVKEDACEQGHTCTSDCQDTVDCPCLNDHCCSMTPKEDLCGEVEDCEYCASQVPDLADLKNDELNDR